MHKIVFALAMVCICTTADAQSRYRFHSMNYIGFLEGQAGSFFQLQTINGLQRSTWFAGVGTGIDYYFLRSVPLFLSVSKYLTAKQRSFFVSADGGLNFLWDKNTGTYANNYGRGQFKPSPYWAGGIGYRIGLSNQRDAVLLNIGYAMKRLKETQRVGFPCQFPPCPGTTEVYTYHFNRLSLKVGWQF